MSQEEDRDARPSDLEEVGVGYPGIEKLRPLAELFRLKADELCELSPTEREALRQNGLARKRRREQLGLSVEDFTALCNRAAPKSVSYRVSEYHVVLSESGLPLGSGEGWDWVRGRISSLLDRPEVS